MNIRNESTLADLMTETNLARTRNFQHEEARIIEHGVLTRLGPLMAGCAANLIDFILLQTHTFFSANNDHASVQEFVVSMSAALNHTNIETVVSFGPFLYNLCFITCSFHIANVCRVLVAAT